MREMLKHTDIVRVQSHRLTYRMKMLSLTQIDGEESENQVHEKFSLVNVGLLGTSGCSCKLITDLSCVRNIKN